MRLGDVLRKEREGRGLSRHATIPPAEMAEKLGLSEQEYIELEAGTSPAEEWGYKLAQAAIQLGVPTSRLLAESGKSADCRPGETGPQLKKKRLEQTARAEEAAVMLKLGLAEYKKRQEVQDGLPRHRTPEEMAAAMGLSAEEYAAVEAGKSPLETVGPTLLRFAETIEQPVFNLFYPCGLSYRELEDYP